MQHASLDTAIVLCCVTLANLLTSGSMLQEYCPQVRGDIHGQCRLELTDHIQHTLNMCCKLRWWWRPLQKYHAFGGLWVLYSYVSSRNPLHMSMDMFAYLCISTCISRLMHTMPLPKQMHGTMVNIWAHRCSKFTSTIHCWKVLQQHTHPRGT